jgi:hypothetical protein
MEEMAGDGRRMGEELTCANLEAMANARYRFGGNRFGFY